MLILPKPKKEFKPYKYKSHSQFSKASFTWRGGDRLLKDIIIFKKSAK